MRVEPSERAIAGLCGSTLRGRSDIDGTAGELVNQRDITPRWAVIETPSGIWRRPLGRG